MYVDVRQAYGTPSCKLISIIIYKESKTHPPVIGVFNVVNQYPMRGPSVSLQNLYCKKLHEYF